MTLPQLNIDRHDRGRRALITLAGEVGPATAPQVRTALERCLGDGITIIDVDLTTVGLCDSSGLRVFLDASRHAETQAFGAAFDRGSAASWSGTADGRRGTASSACSG
ncbi:STAS domain-containing protein [Streptomyces sp. NPDC002838]|uniref:STAS domain-containing protein n=1 Tax=Streptomyces sp. NPDC002838 TaxID=3154436 RepID=UPI003317772E